MYLKTETVGLNEITFKTFGRGDCVFYISDSYRSEREKKKRYPYQITEYIYICIGVYMYLLFLVY